MIKSEVANNNQQHVAQHRCHVVILLTMLPPSFLCKPATHDKPQSCCMLLLRHVIREEGLRAETPNSECFRSIRPGAGDGAMTAIPYYRVMHKHASLARYKHTSAIVVKSSFLANQNFRPRSRIPNPSGRLQPLSLPCTKQRNSEVTLFMKPAPAG